MSYLQARTDLHLFGTLKFVEADYDYSIYTDRDGDEVYLAHGTGKILAAFAALDLTALWTAHRTEHGSWTWDEFTTILRTLTYEPDEVEWIAVCNDCDDVENNDDMYTVNGDDRVCDSCLSDYWWCNDCEEYCGETTTTLDGTEVCDSCRNRSWTYCEHCDGYRGDEDYEHDHDEDCDCEAPGQEFSIRNDGEAPLANDTRTTVTLPAGVISEEGLAAIENHLVQESWKLTGDDAITMRTVAYGLADLGDKWQAKDGNYTKRVSRMAYKSFGFKVSPEIISTIGNIAREHSVGIDFEIETTRNLNLPAEDFGHEGSCYWTEYASSRCTLKANGAFGLRTFSEDTWSGVSGRAWVMPLKLDENDRLRPTTNTESPDAFVVFNGYGDLEGYSPARIMSHMAGMTYRKVSFTASPMYINSDSGYLVAPEEIAEGYTDGELHLYLDEHSNLYYNERNVYANA